MPVTTPLHAEGALERAREALVPYGLILRRVGSNRYVVTRAPPADAAGLPSNASEQSHSLDEISVYASRYTLAGNSIAEPKGISGNHAQQIPGGQYDALRAIRLLPGVVSNGSSRPYIRGSGLDDLLVQFDGVPLADPFHLKDFQSLISAFDPAAVDRVEVYSGGFPARYGTRSGGVIDITPRSLESGYDNSIGASLLAYNMSSVGHAQQWPVDWLATVRHSTSDVVLKPVNAQVGEPQFQDSVGRLRWNPSADSACTFGWLLLDDRITLATDPFDETAKARYRDEYGWIAYDQDVGENAHSRTVIAVTRSERTRIGALRLGSLATGHVNETRDSSRTELRSDWTLHPSPGLAMDYGLEATHATADLRYQRSERFQKAFAAGFGRPADNSLTSHVTPEVSTYALSGAIRRRWSSFEAELGMRLDGQHYLGYDGSRQWSPRLNMRYDLGQQWHVYGSSGRFSQAQRVEEWRVEESQVAPDMAELSVHTILGLAYERSANTHFGVELYNKRWTHVSPYFDNLLEKLTLLPDLAPDRTRIAPTHSAATGVEFSAQHAISAHLESWVTYALSRVADEFSTGEVVRSWDQPRAFTFGLAGTDGRASAAAVLGWHRGWPRTPFTWRPATTAMPDGFTLGARNSSRWGNYFTVDVRAAWDMPLARSDISTWAEVTNGADRHNACCVRFTTLHGDAETTIAQPNSWFPRVFNVGVTWRFRDRR